MKQSVPRSGLALLAIAMITSACSIVDSIANQETAPPMSTLAPVTTVAPPTAPRPTPTLPPPVPAGLCDSYAEPTATGTVTTAAVTEASGIATSRTHPGTLWMHNDSGGGPFVFATDLAGNNLGRFEIDVPAFDWEDMAIGPGPDPTIDYLYLGDIGDNFHFRPAVTVHRIAEPAPDPAGGFITEAASFNLAYPEPGFDSEAMMVDPLTGDIFLVTKGSAGEPADIYRAPVDELTDGGLTEMELVATFDLEAGAFVTAADIDATGAVIVFRGYNQVWLWERTDLSLVATFAAEPCRTPSTAEIQGEAIAFADQGFSYLTVSEGENPDINLVTSNVGS